MKPTHEDCPRLLRAFRRMAGGALCAVLAIGFAAQGLAQAPAKCGFLFIVDTSSGMAKLSESAQQTLASLIASGLHGEIRAGEEVAVWTFNDEINSRGMPVLTWTPGSSQSVALQTVSVVRAQKFRRASRMDRLIPELLQAMRTTELMVAVILSDGAEVIVGTPVDRRINVTFGSRAVEMRAAKKPFVTVLAARRGEIVDHAVAIGDEPFTLPNFRPALVRAGATGTALPGFAPPTSVPVLVRPGSAPVAATNVLVPTPAAAKAATTPTPTAAPTAAAPAANPPTINAPDSRKRPEVQPAPAEAKAAPKKDETRVDPTPKPSTPIPPPSVPVAKTNVTAPSQARESPVQAATQKQEPPKASAATVMPVLITNRPPAAPLGTAVVPKGDFLATSPPKSEQPAPTPSAPVKAATPPPPVVQEIPTHVTPVVTNAPQPAASTIIGSDFHSVVKGPGSNPPVVAPVIPATVAHIPAASPALPTSNTTNQTAPPATVTTATQLAVAQPVGSKWRQAGLLAGAALLAFAGFWILRPWLRRPEPTAPSSLISRSMDERSDR